MNLPARLREAISGGNGRPPELLPGDAVDDLPLEPGVAAAVLIAVTDRAEPGLILTQRPDTMRRHPGQVAFPGGRVDAADESIIAAALREAEEEIALPPHLVDVIGAVPPYRTVTGYQVTPVIGVIPPDLVLIPNADEVAAIFEVPLAFVLDPANHATRRVDWHGSDRHYYEMHWDGFRIWGATAAMIVNLSRHLAWQA
jgi:8-oxo-dGTP pyrophosphatase MutT (NUDIX family)